LTEATTAELSVPRSRSTALTAAAAFAITLAALVGGLALSAALFAEVAVLRDPDSRRLTRFCGFLALVTAYVAAAIVIARQGARRDFAELRAVTDATPEEWGRYERRFLDRAGPRVAAAIGFGVGLGIDWLGGSVSPFDATQRPWAGLTIWTALLNGLCFAGLGVLVRWSLLEIRALRGIGRRARVSLLERDALAPFVRTGLRGALLWLGGSSLATTLLLDVNTPWIVLVVLALTTGLAAAVLLLPSRGLHERLRAVKRTELARVRAEIDRARSSLFDGDAPAREASARLPALLAWEARVEGTSEWPFDTPTLLRFAFLLLVPLGSWLGGALVERLVDAFMGN
jgi:hypothetical protein